MLHIVSENPGVRRFFCMIRPLSDKDTNPSKDDFSALQQRTLGTHGTELALRALSRTDVLP